MTELKSLTLWVRCPMLLTHRSIEICNLPCPYFAGSANNVVFCTFENGKKIFYPEDL